LKPGHRRSNHFRSVFFHTDANGERVLQLLSFPRDDCLINNAALLELGNATLGFYLLDRYR
jgi:hypothetical protein